MSGIVAIIPGTLCLIFITVKNMGLRSAADPAAIWKKQEMMIGY